VGAEEEEEAQDGEQRDEVHGARRPKRPRRRNLLVLRLHVVVVMAAFLRQELGHRRDAQLPLHPHEISPCSRRNSQGKELAVWACSLTTGQGKVYAR
jgi:hypothetical protein